MRLWGTMGKEQTTLPEQNADNSQCHGKSHALQGDRKEDGAQTCSKRVDAPGKEGQDSRDKDDV